jgi:hypothetical protein
MLDRHTIQRSGEHERPQRRSPIPAAGSLTAVDGTPFPIFLFEIPYDELPLV